MVVAFICVVALLFAFSGWLILNQVGETGIMEQPSTEDEAAQLAEMTIQNTFPGSQEDDFPLVNTTFTEPRTGG